MRPSSSPPLQARLRVHSTSLNVPMRTEATEATWSGPMRRRVSLQFHEKGVMSYADALSDAWISVGISACSRRFSGLRWPRHAKTPAEGCTVTGNSQNNMLAIESSPL